MRAFPERLLSGLDAPLWTPQMAEAITHAIRAKLQPMRNPVFLFQVNVPTTSAFR